MRYHEIIKAASVTGLVRSVYEAIVVKKQFEMGGQLRNFAIHMNPSHAEATMLLNRSENQSLRGLMREKDGFVAVWDAYLMDHAEASDVLLNNGLGDWWPRFAIEGMTDFSAGIVDIYLERDEDDTSGRGMSANDWKKLPVDRLTRMLGKPPRYREG